MVEEDPKNKTQSRCQINASECQINDTVKSEIVNSAPKDEIHRILAFVFFDVIRNYLFTHISRVTSLARG